MHFSSSAAGLCWVVRVVPVLRYTVLLLPAFGENKQQLDQPWCIGQLATTSDFKVTTACAHCMHPLNPG